MVAPGCCQTSEMDDLLNYESPIDAFKKGPREKIMYVACVNANLTGPDYVAVVDIDDQSKTFCNVIHRVFMPTKGDELHHFGWNHCVGCKYSGNMKRTHMLLPTLHSDRVYAVNIEKDPLHPFIEKVVELKSHGLTFAHTTHCLPNGKVLVSTMGDKDGRACGNFAQLNGDNFEFEQKWSSAAPFGYDFWYQPRHDVMISTSWGPPSMIKTGLKPDNLPNYGHHLFFWNWTTKKLEQTIDLGAEDGCMALEIRMCHDPTSIHGYIASGFGSSLFHFYKDQNTWKCDRVVKISPLKVKGFAMDSIPAVLTDIIISMDDRYIYVSAWLHGYVAQYNIEDKFAPRLVSKINIGGCLIKPGPITVLEDNFVQPEALIVKGRKVEGGAQMLQLSLDGKRLYITPSLYSAWDKQFYPDMIKHGSCMLRVNVDTVKEKMTLDETFLVDFGKEPDGPVLAHEMRYPGGDCSSDIFV